jgi:hypothetical protein
VVAVQPQPRQMPLPPFDKGDLQRIFADVGLKYPYEMFGYIFEGRGAQFNNGPEDVVELRPALLRVQAKMDGSDLLTASMAEDKAMWILKTATERLKVPAFIQCAIQILASVSAPNDDAKHFVAERLMHDTEQAAELGPDYFGGGVRFRRIRQDTPGEDNLTVEPDLNDNSLVYLDHQRARLAMGPAEPFDLSQVSTWVNEAFEFLAGPTMQLLSR